MFSGLNASINNGAANQLTYRAQLGSTTNIGQDGYGQSVALYGDYLLVGTNRNQFVVLSGANNVFSGAATSMTKELVIGNYTSGSAVLATGQPSLANSGNFGAEVAINANGLAIVGDYTRNTNGQVHFMNLAQSTGDAVGSAAFSTNAASNSTIFPSAITAVLNTGANLTLQANNDITVSAAVSANNPSGNGGGLTLQAGRSITFNQGVTTDNGSLTVTSGDANADAANRDAGTATVTVASGKTLNVGSGNLTLSADALALSGTLTGTGSLTIQPSTSGTTIGVAGGSGSLLLPASYFSTNITNGFSSIVAGGATSGLVTVGNSALSYNDPLTLKSGGSIFFSSSSALTGAGNSLTLWSRAGGNDAANDGVLGSVWLPQGSSISTGGGNVTIGGGTSAATGYALGDNGATSTENNARYRGVTVNGTINAAGGNIAILGRGNASTAARGVSIGGTVGTTGSGTIDISGIANGTSDGLALGDSTVGINGTVSAVNGTLTLSGTKDSGSNGINLSTALSKVQTSGSGSLAFNSTGAINGTGYAVAGGTSSFTAGANAITLASASNDFTGAVSLSNSGANNVSLRDANALVLGTVAVGSVTVSIQSGGTVTQAGAITQTAGAGAVSLNAGGSNLTLTNPGNDFKGTVNISNAANIGLLDADTLVLGAMNSSITGTIDVATTTGNISISQNIATSSTSANAIKINAGKSAAPGTATGGDIVISGSPSITPGTGGFATLYTGSIAGSTGLEALIGAGSGRFRYNADETTAGFPVALTAGVNAVYRAVDPNQSTSTTTTTVSLVEPPPPPQPPVMVPVLPIAPPPPIEPPAAPPPVEPVGTPSFQPVSVANDPLPLPVPVEQPSPLPVAQPVSLPPPTIAMMRPAPLVQPQPQQPKQPGALPVSGP
ncbi:MAG: S-layer family protein, partial [Rhodoferax sp.]|nr:S-layer family protein [Rhodoferax sp.]